MKKIDKKAIGLRFKRIRIESKVSQKDIIKGLERTNEQYISDIETGRKEPVIGVLNYMHRKFNVNLNWLVTGEGDPFIRDAINIDYKEKYYLQVEENSALYKKLNKKGK